ncbi:hypothetical protein WR25_15667 [Diploscapter pachys]|uniref:Uncharacterized protein n=1 Tax=Diploscapter pachys TaxID=2018661 RepID=A0A2A2JC22_9BILA|nr:hypothetical protein WR25_15667 [Diploscapter pachys]
MSELEVLTNLCRQLYAPTDGTVRRQAEENLAQLVESPECLRSCMLLLEQGEVPYGPLVASMTLTKYINQKVTIRPEQKLELGRYILSQLGQRASSLPAYVVTSLCQLFVRIVKQEWLYRTSGSNQEYPFHEQVKSIMEAAKSNNFSESVLAMQILALLIQDMNSGVGLDSVSAHRTTLASFRDTMLYDIYKLGVKYLETIVVNGAKVSEEAVQVALDLVLNSLSFDFICANPDETTEDNYNVQVPALWRLSFVDGKVICMCFALYGELPTSCTQKLFQIMVQLASMRRTLFNATERQAYLECFVNGIKSVLSNPSKLGDQATFHEFCRLVGRLKTNFQLAELMKTNEYASVLAMIADFTVQSLGMIEFAGNSSYFLMTFWQRMVSSVPYVTGSDRHMLETACPNIYFAFVKSRLEYCENVVKEGAEDPLDDHGNLMQMMEQLSVICRCDYAHSMKVLSSAFDENARIFQQGGESMDMRIAELRLAWLVTLIGTAIFGKTAEGSNEEHENYDGQLFARVIKLMRLNDERIALGTNNNGLPLKGNKKLEVAFIHALEHFRRAYIMDQYSQISKGCKVYERLQQEIGVIDENGILGIIVRKILTNLKYWSYEETILELSLALLKDLSLGYAAVRRLFRIDEVQRLLNNHSVEHFPFLGHEIDIRSMKHRTIFYESMMRLLSTELNDNEDMFIKFVQPLTDTIEGVIQVASGASGNINGVSEEQLKRIIIGLMRDIRGISNACATKQHFLLLFEWCYPNVFNIMYYVVEKWPNDPNVVTPVCRLLAEMSQNKQQRLKFEMNSCSAVLLFKEISKIVTKLGESILRMRDVPKDRIYKDVYKNIGIIFFAIKSALVGQYIPFGVFHLYGDSCLNDVLQTIINLFVMIPEDELLTYTKIAQNFYSLLEHLVQDNMVFVSNLDEKIFVTLVRAIHNGIASLDSMIITSACATLDTILTYIFRRLTRTTPIQNNLTKEVEGDNILIAVKNNSNIMAELLRSFFHIIIFSEVKCQWSMSRPMLGLILMQPEQYEALKQDILNTPTLDQAQKEKLNIGFDQLMQRVETNLTVRNKDNFTQNLSKFRKDANEICKGNDVLLTAPSRENEMS